MGHLHQSRPLRWTCYGAAADLVQGGVLGPTHVLAHASAIDRDAFAATPILGLVKLIVDDGLQDDEKDAYEDWICRNACIRPYVPLLLISNISLRLESA
jgi:hypothetical protein